MDKIVEELARYKALKKQKGDSEDRFDLLVKNNCKYQKLWIDTYDGEEIYKCKHKKHPNVNKSLVECSVHHCPLGE